MAEGNINAYCAICGKGYHCCNTCLEEQTFKPWRSIVDSIEHFKIYCAIHSYTLHKDKEKAKEELKECDLSELESFNLEIKSVIKEIMEDTKKKHVTTKGKRKTENSEHVLKMQVEKNIE